MKARSTILSILSIAFVFFQSTPYINSQVRILPTEDAYTQIKNTGENADDNMEQVDAEKKLYVKGSIDWNRNCYLKFDISSVDPMELSKATLEVWAFKVDINVEKNNGKADRPQLEVYGVMDNSWTENTITWNNAPLGTYIYIQKFDTVISKTLPISQSVLLAFDVTEWIRARLNDLESFATIQLGDTAITYTEIKIVSKDYADAPDSLKPYLVINYGTGVKEIEEIMDIPNTFWVSNAYPNPFNPETRINFRLTKPGMVDIVVFDTAGRVVNSLCNQQMQQGNHQILWNGMDGSGQENSSGIYFARIIAEGQTRYIKMTLIR